MTMTDIDLDAIRADLKAADDYIDKPSISTPLIADELLNVIVRAPALIAEVERLRAENVCVLATVKRLETEFPCDGGCSPETGGPQEDCSLHGRSPRELWQIFGELQQQRDDVRAENDTLKKRVAAYYYALGVVAKPRTTIGGDVA